MSQDFEYRNKFTPQTSGEKTMKTLIKSPSLGVKLRSNTMLTTIAAAAVAMGSITPAYATMDNTVTVSGSAPNGDPVIATAFREVDLIDAAPALSIVKSASLTTDADADTNGDAGDVITYTFTVTNEGESSLDAVSVVDTFADAAGSLGTIEVISFNGSTVGPNIGLIAVDMLPDDVAIFEATYTILAGDITAAGGGTPDGDLDNSAVAQGTYPDGDTNPTITSPADTAEVPLDVTSELTVTKGATFIREGGLVLINGIDDNVPVGTVVTYTYVIENTGVVPVTNVTINDVHVATGTFIQPDIELADDSTVSANSTNNSINNAYDVLWPGDSITVTATYTVTQQDVDQLQ